MNARQELFDALRLVLPGSPGLAVIHSSVSSIAETRLGRWDVLPALNSLVEEGWTIALPSFTFSFCGGKRFDLRSSGSETGCLSDWALASLPGARRTPHPIYSFVVCGPSANEMVALRPVTTFGEGSCFEFFEQRDAVLVMLGCGWKFCTQFHRYEELAGVPYRFYKDFSGEARLDAGEVPQPVSARMFVRDLEIDAENDFSPVVEALRLRGAIAAARVWRGDVESVPVSSIACVAKEQLSRDPLAHVRYPAEVAFKLAKKKEATENEPLRIAVLGHSNVQHLRAALEQQLAGAPLGRRFEFYCVPFGQLMQCVVNPDSELSRFAPHVSIFVDRLEDLAGSPSVESLSAEAIADRVEYYGDLIVRHAATYKGWTIVSRFVQFTHGFGPSARELPALVDGLNAALAAKLAGIDQLVWLDLAREVSRAQSPVFDRRLWLMGRFPFAEPFSRQLAKRWGGLIIAALGKSARLIVLDLDNTMWGGVLGEDGIEGLQLGSDYPGNAFTELQRALLRLASRGIALGVVSKNDADLALKAIEEHPGMAIRGGDIVSHRINWKPKWSNIVEICDELGLGPESVLLIDDNPVEREQVRRNLPAAKVLDLPDDPTDYVAALESSVWLDAAIVTAEDLKRVNSYRHRSEIERQRRSAADIEEFYSSLAMRLYLQPLDPGNIARAVQLAHKTNQFNTTTRRYDRAQLEAIAGEGGDAVVIGLSDKYTERENIGLIILRPHPTRRDWGLVENYLLSCRVLGRGLETAILHWALERARRRKWDGLAGVVVETDRNTPVRAVFRDAGFLCDVSSGEWTMSVGNTEAFPDWLTVHDGMPDPERRTLPST